MTLLQRWRQQLTPLAQRALALPPPPGGLRLWITLLSFGFVLAALVTHGGQLLQLRLDLQGWLWLLLGTGLSLVSLVVNGFGLGVVLRWLGLRPRWQQLVLDYLDTNLRKYLPGGIWHLTSRVQLLRGAEAPLSQPASTSQALLAVLLDPLVAAVAALALVPLGGWQAGLAVGALVPLAMLWPQWLQPLLLRLERRQAARLGLEAAAATATAPRIPGYPWPPLLAQLVFVLLRFSGFACCVLAYELQGSLEWTGWLAGFALAWTAGLVVPGAPGGLGVFEAVLLLRMGMAVPEAQLLAVAISYRAVVTLGDLLADAVARLDRRWQG